MNEVERIKSKLRRAEVKRVGDLLPSDRFFYFGRYYYVTTVTIDTVYANEDIPLIFMIDDTRVALHINTEVIVEND